MNLQFTKYAAMPEEVIEKYASKVPDELVELWQQYGLGFLLDGYLKIINPEEYIEFVEATYFRGTNGVPLFVTCFGDIIIYTQNGFIDIIYYANNDFDVMTQRIDHFIKFLDDDSFLEDFLIFLSMKKRLRSMGTWITINALVLFLFLYWEEKGN